MVISSKDNKLIKLLQKLTQKKYRDEYGLFVVEGFRNVKDIIDFDKTLIQNIFISNSSYDNIDNSFENALLVEERILNSVSETKSPQGIMAIVKKPESKNITSDYVLFLDKVRDPGNVGTLIRTACACGYNDVILSDCADPFSGKVARSTMSALVKINLIFASERELELLKSNSYEIICADLDGKNLFEYKPTSKICVIIGNEANGISDEIKALSHTSLTIPMSKDIESLNAAISGGIMMYNLKYNK